MVIINGETASLEEVVLYGPAYRFHLTETEVGVRGRCADRDGGEQPDLWYAVVRPQFRP